MNAAQFKVVKSMQAIGIKPEAFAAATNTDVTTMKAAYFAGTHSQMLDMQELHAGKLASFLKGFGL